MFAGLITTDKPVLSMPYAELEFLLSEHIIIIIIMMIIIIIIIIIICRKDIV